MNNLIKEQLSKVKVAILPSYDENTTKIIIPKLTKQVLIENNLLPQLGRTYIIELEDYLLRPSDNFTLHVNWNNNIIPKDKVMKATVVNDIGKMIKINGKGYLLLSDECNDNKWEGWIPKKSIKIIKEI